MISGFVTLGVAEMTLTGRRAVSDVFFVRTIVTVVVFFVVTPVLVVAGNRNRTIGSQQKFQISNVKCSNVSMFLMLENFSSSF